MGTRAETVILEGKLYVRVEHCKGCGFCVEFCPKHVLFISADFNAKGYHPPGVDPAAKCSNCKLCELLCPEFAIFSPDSLKTGAAVKAAVASSGLEVRP
jgi:2-oxoglutarate ferredoxin oxidoreductase subunit delta